MDIVVYSGFTKRINSTKRPTGGSTISVRLKEPTSVIRPTFILTGFNTSWNYIQWGTRYYFVDDIVILTNNQAAYTCSLDVLATYKDVIGSSSQYVARAAGAFDGTIADSYYPIKSQQTYQKKTADSGNTWFVMPELGTFVFGIVGQTDADSYGSTTYYVLDIYGAKALMDELFNMQNNAYDAATVESVAGVPEALYKSILNPAQYIVSCMFLPFEAESVGSGAQESIKIGWYDVGESAVVFNPSFDALPEIHGTFTLPKHPQAARGVYMNNEPFTDYTLSFAPFGELTLPADSLITATTIYYKVIVDVITGQGTLKVYSGSDDTGQLLLSESAQVGVPVAVTGGVYDTSIGATAKKAATGWFTNILQSLRNKELTTSTPYIHGIMDSVMTPNLSTSGANGALLFLEYPPLLYAKFNHVVNDDNAQLGRPLCEIRVINTLSGYIKCLNADLDTAGTKEEKSAAISYLNGGFFYE